MKQTIKYFLFGLTFCVFNLVASGQRSEIDSLLSVIKTTRLHDTAKVNILQTLSWKFQYSNPDTSILLNQQALEIAEKIQWRRGVSITLGNLGAFNYLKGNYPEALQYYFKALSIDEKAGDKNGMARHLGNIGAVYKDQGDYAKALEYLFLALKLNETLHNKRYIAANTGNIGIIYHLQRDHRQALDYYHMALRTSEELGSRDLVSTWTGNIGIIHKDLGDYSSALACFAKALKINEELGYENRIAATLDNIGSVYIKTANYSNAEKILQNGLSISAKLGALDLLKDHHQNLSELYTQKGNYKKAFEHYKQYILIRDSLYNEENIKKTVRAEMNFNFEKKAALAKVEQEKKNAMEAAENRRKKIITVTISFVLFLVTVFSILLLNRFRLTRKQKQIIEEKNKNITESITYAQRIQQAKLPDKEVIYRSLPQCFVLFKPKDIVSGDFYYFHKNKEAIFIASADCTGHGVPGAFMSMIGSEKLDEALAHSTDTSTILSHLNKGIRSSLRQTDNIESTRDGMDIAFCAVNMNTRLIKYAGANRPLWLIREGQGVVEEIKATKKAIGGFTEDSQHFETHVLQLQQGDTFYLSTDGYADTFGGPENKKLTTKKFKEILLSIQHKSLKEQEAQLDHFIEAWKGETEQVDDILVIGIRL